MSFKSFKTSYQFRNKTVKTVDPNSTGYDIIGTDSQIIYYSFNAGTVSGSDVSNYATGTGVKDATLLGSAKILNNTLYTQSSGNLDGLSINRVIDTINSGNWITIATWFNCVARTSTYQHVAVLTTVTIFLSPFCCNVDVELASYRYNT
jgi:hypothetical protein